MTSSEPLGRPPFPGKLAAAVGHVVLEASQCEDTLGELVALHRRGAGEDDTDWWTSGERLADAVSVIDDSDAAALAHDYRSLSRSRHIVVHGVWLPGSAGHQVMLRGKSTRSAPRPPTYELGISGETELADLAADFNRLERRAANAISRFMGLA